MRRSIKSRKANLQVLIDNRETMISDETADMYSHYLESQEGVLKDVKFKFGRLYCEKLEAGIRRKFRDSVILIWE